MIESVQVVNALRTSVLARQVLAILESNPRTEATALKTRDVLLNEFSPYNAFVQSLTDDELLMAVSVLAVHHPTGTTAGSEILVLPPYRRRGLGKRLLTNKVKWYQANYSNAVFETKVANDNMSSINMCLASGLKLQRCIEATKRTGEKFNQLVFTT